MYSAIAVNNEVVAVVGAEFKNEYMALFAGHKQGPLFAKQGQFTAFNVENDVYIGFSHGANYVRKVVDVVGGHTVSVAVEV